MIFFFDRNFGRSLPRAMAELGSDVRSLYDEFPVKTDDDVWLAHVGPMNWVVITHDKKFASRQNELQALIDANVRCFVLPAAEEDKWTKARAFAVAWEHIVAVYNSETSPYVWRLTSLKGRWIRVFPF